MPAQLEETEHELSICPAAAVGELQTFLDQYWRKNHILAASRTLLDFQHLDKSRNRYNFVIARGQGGRLDAVLGFIPTSQFDAALEARRDIWLAIWKVRPDAGSTGLGLSLLQYLVRELDPRTVSAIGLNPAVIPIYRYLKFSAGKLEHFYIANRNKSEFKLLGGFDGRHDWCAQDIADKTLELCEPAGVEHFAEQRPVKSAAYLVNRYANHPGYRYEFREIRRSGRSLGALVLRTAIHEGSKALRIVDFVGKPAALAGCRLAFQSLLAETGAEYIDFYCHGLSPDAVYGAGFLKREPHSPVVVPNYFEPFEKRTVELDFACKFYGPPSPEPFVLFKGDSDQDRPSMPAAAELAA